MDYLSDIQRLVLVLFITVLIISALRESRRKTVTGAKRGSVWVSALIVLAVMLLNLNFYIPSYNIQVFFAVTFVLGILIVHWAERHISRKEETELVISGPYSLVRHPIYTGLVVAYISFLVLFFNPVVIALTAIYLALLMFAAISEERFLHETLPGYPDYALRTGRFLPKVKRHKK
jgi:protein-S-isoprenylcysteine O-methyltransferase Ste14